MMAFTAQCFFTRHNRSWNVSLTLGLLFLLSSISNSISFSSQNVSGVDYGIKGDFEKFSCDYDEHGLGIMGWKYKLKNGDILPVEESDKLKSLEIEDSLRLTSFIRLHSADIDEIICQQSVTSFKMKKVQVYDLSEVTTRDDPCAMAKEMGRPMTVFETISDDVIPPYRKTHFSGAQPLLLKYPTDVSQIKVTCFSANAEEPRLSLKEDMFSKMKFAAWGLQPSTVNTCKRQVMVIYQIGGQPSDMVDISLHCRTSESASSPIHFTFKIDDTISGRSSGDLNATQNCIDKVVDSFYDKELTGVGVGGSVAIVLMMVGIAVLKKQLNQQQKINQDLQAGSSYPLPGGSGTSAPGPSTAVNIRSTEELTAK